MSQNKKITKKSILRTVLLSFAALVFGLSIYNWNAENLVGDKMPMPLGIGASVIMSGSMEPRLSVDDLVIIKKTDQIKVDDIIVFQDEDILVIHRVIEIDGDKIVTKGEANGIADDPISIQAVKGVLVCDIPYVGIIVRILKHPVTVISVMLAAFLLANRSFRKEKEKDADELDNIKKEIAELMKDIKNS